MLKINIANKKDIKNYTFEDKNFFNFRKIGDIVLGSFLGVEEYKDAKLKITGASSETGTPYSHLSFYGRKYLLLKSGKKYFKSKIKGQRKKKSIFGNVLTKDLSQVNLAVFHE